MVVWKILQVASLCSIIVLMFYCIFNNARRISKIEEEVKDNV